MTREIRSLKLERFQGFDDGGSKFGYVWACGDGGFFFTWRETLDETIDSLEVDMVSGDDGLGIDEVREFLRSEIEGDFPCQS